MQLTTILGLVLGFGGIVAGQLLEGGNLLGLFQLNAGLIVFGGTLGAVVLSNRGDDLRLGFGFLKFLMSDTGPKDRARIGEEINDAAVRARKDNILALEAQLPKFSDPFMRTVYRFVIDGVDAAVLRQVFEEEIHVNERRKLAGAKIWTDAGGFAPTVGIIGAVLGLIGVMSNIADTSALGQGIAVAFVATIYGVASANLIFLPFSNKIKGAIKFRSETEMMIVEGAVSIVAGLSPFLIEQKIRAYTEVRGV